MSARRLRRNKESLTTVRIVPKEILIPGNTTDVPRILLENLSQTDPAGRYRIQVSGDGLQIQRALTALWNTVQDIFVYDVTNNLVTHSATQAAAMRQIISAGSGAEATSIELGTVSGAGRSIVFKTQNGSTRLTLDKPGSVARAVFGASVEVVLESILAGSGGANVRIQGNHTVTDATAFRVTLEALNVTGDAQVVSAQAVPNGANPFFSIFAPDVAPTTSILDTNNLGLRYTPAGAVVLYVNNAGAIKSLSLGTPA